MAVIAKSGLPSLASQLPANENVLVGICDEAGGIVAGDALYVSGVSAQYDQPKFKKSKAANGCIGFADRSTPNGQAVAALKNVQMHYGAGLTPGDEYSLSGATFGAIDTVKANAANGICAVALTDTVIEVRPVPRGANL